MSESSDTSNPSNRRLSPTGAVAIVVMILVILFLISWILTRGVEDDPQRQNQIPANSPTSGQAVPNQPSNSAESTGGSSAAGTGNSNDPAIGTPSPAGGVDTNGTTSTGTAP